MHSSISRKRQLLNKINKIYYITYQTFPAETANSLQTISNIKHILKLGMNVHLIFPLREQRSSDDVAIINSFYEEDLHFDITGTDHKYPFGKFKLFNRLLFLMSHFLWSRKTVMNILEKKDNSVGFFTRSDWVFYFLSKNNKNVVFECHQFTKIRKFIISSSLKNPGSKIIFLNENLKNDYEKRFKLNNNFVILQNGVDESLFESTAKNNNQIIFVGKLTRFGKSRNIDYLINSFSQLDESYKLKIIGATEPEREKYQKIVGELKIDRRVKIFEFMSHRKVVKHILESEIGVLINTIDNAHSTKYTSPLKYFEYLYADVKVIASNFEAHKKLPFSENIKFFNIGDSSSFVKSVIEVQDTPTLDKNKKEKISLDLRAKEILNLFN